MNDPAFRFSIHPGELCRQLRDMADRIESEDVLPQMVTQQVRNTTEDFEIKTFLFKYAEKR